MIHTLNHTPNAGTASPAAIFTDAPAAGMICLRTGFDGVRTLCLTPIRNESRLGDVTAADPWLEETVAPLVARFGALMLAEHEATVEPLLQQLRWIAYEHGIDHVALPLWPEARLAQQLVVIATDLGMPANFILTQDETCWPGSDKFAAGAEINDLEGATLYA